MKPMIYTQIVARSTLWSFLFCYEVLARALMNYVPLNHWYFIGSVATAVVLFAMTFRFRDDALIIDIRELCLYDVFAQVIAVLLYFYWYNTTAITSLTYTTLILKFVRLGWPALTDDREAFRAWPVFGIISYLARKQKLEFEEMNPRSVLQDRLAYACLILVFPIVFFLRYNGVKMPLAFFAGITTVAIFFSLKPIIDYLEKRQQQFVEMITRVAVAETIAAKSRELAIANNQLTEKNQELAEAHGALRKLLVERERDQAVLEKYNAALRDAAHDMQHPMAVVRIYAERLMQLDSSGNTPPTVRKQVEEDLSEAMDQMVEFIDATIHSAQVVTGIVKPHIAALDMDKLAKQFQANWLDAANKQGLDRFDIYPKWPTDLYCAGDLMIVKRILRNLLANAIMHSPQGGGILLSMRRRNGNCLIQVWDKGPGIAEGVGKDGHANFATFAARVRGDGGGAQMRKGGGYGLGMNNVLQLCTAAGLQMQLHARMGRGSVFGFILPLAEASLIAETEKYRLDDELDLDEVRAMLRSMSDLPMPKG